MFDDLLLTNIKCYFTGKLSETKFQRERYQNKVMCNILRYFQMSATSLLQVSSSSTKLEFKVSSPKGF